jgi:ribose-phosphate pyrophosphokinase
MTELNTDTRISIFTTDDRPEFLRRLVNACNTFGNHFKTGKLKITTFANGEHSPTFMESVRGKKVFLVGSTNSDANLMKLLLSIDAAKRASAKEVIAIIPFLGYSRQDRKDARPGHLRSAIGASVVAAMLESVGVDQVVTVDLHAEQIQGFFRKPVNHIECSKLIASTIKKQFDQEMLVLCSPDAGGVKRLTKVMEYLPSTVDMAMISKQRGASNEIDRMSLVGDVKGKDVVIVDDMIDSGGTLVAAANLIKTSGARSVHTVATHGLFSNPAFERITSSESLSTVTVTNTLKLDDDIPSKISVIGVEAQISNLIRGITFGHSTSSGL